MQSLINSDEEKSYLLPLISGKEFYGVAKKFTSPSGSIFPRMSTSPSGSIIHRWTEAPTKFVESEIEEKLCEMYNLLLDSFSNEVEYQRRRYEEARRLILFNTKEIYAIRKELNLHKIEKITLLKKNWAGDEGEPIERSIISKARDLILSSKLIVQPQIFPTRDGTIQFEYQESDIKFLTIEILRDKYKVYSDINGKESEFETEDFDKIIPFIDEFRQK